METERQLMWPLLNVCEIRGIREEEEDAQEGPLKHNMIATPA